MNKNYVLNRFLVNLERSLNSVLNTKPIGSSPLYKFFMRRHPVYVEKPNEISVEIEDPRFTRTRFKGDKETSWVLDCKINISYKWVDSVLSKGAIENEEESSFLVHNVVFFSKHSLTQLNVEKEKDFAFLVSNKSIEVLLKQNTLSDSVQEAIKLLRDNGYTVTKEE